MDTWLTTETMIKSVLDEGLHVIGMVKQLKQKYSYHGYSCDLKELRTLLPKKNPSKTCIRSLLSIHFLEWLKREENDMKTFGELFLMYCDDIQDMDLTTALQSLMGLFVDHINTKTNSTNEIIKNQLIQWLNSQALFIKALFKDLKRES